MRQIETSRTLVFDAPRRARGFFEALVADYLDIGRPDFGRKVYSNSESPFSTKAVTRGVDVIVNVLYKLPELQTKAARCQSSSAEYSTWRPGLCRSTALFERVALPSLEASSPLSTPHRE